MNKNPDYLMDAVIVICTYNEADNIAPLLAALAAYPIILVDSESPDGTAEIACQFPNVSVTCKPNEGIASAYRYGLTLASKQHYEYVVQMDAGGTHDLVLIPAMLTHAQKRQAGLVIGSRFCWAAPFLSYRTVISLAAAWLMRRKGVPVRDATSGFRVWRREWLQAALMRPSRALGFAFQLELLYNAQRAGVMIAEFPIPYRLTNSSFRWGMVVEALTIIGGMD